MYDAMYGILEQALYRQDLVPKRNYKAGQNPLKKNTPNNTTTPIAPIPITPGTKTYKGKYPSITDKSASKSGYTMYRTSYKTPPPQYRKRSQQATTQEQATTTPSEPSVTYPEQEQFTPQETYYENQEETPSPEEMVQQTKEELAPVTEQAKETGKKAITGYFSLVNYLKDKYDIPRWLSYSLTVFVAYKIIRKIV